LGGDRRVIFRQCGFVAAEPVADRFVTIFCVFELGWRNVESIRNLFKNVIVGLGGVLG